jgi:hypothetical protein
MSAHDWPEFESFDTPMRRTAETDKENDWVAVNRSQYNYAKVRIEVCAGFENESLQLIAESGGFAQMQVEYIDNVSKLRQQRDALRNATPHEWIMSRPDGTKMKITIEDIHQ